MSRVAKAPIPVAKGVEVKITGQNVNVKGAKGSMSMDLHDSVLVEQDGGELKVKPATESTAAWAMAGTMRALLNNMVVGVSTGFERKLQLSALATGLRVRARS